jgi:hypothetical protein
LTNAWQCKNCFAFTEKQANVTDQIWDQNREKYIAEMAQVLFPVIVVPDDGGAETRGVPATHGDSKDRRNERKALNAAQSVGRDGVRNQQAEKRLRKGGQPTSYPGFESGAYPTILERFLHDT